MLIEITIPSLVLDSDFSSKPRAVSKFFSMFLTLSLSLFTAPARSGKFPKETFPLNQAISQKTPIQNNSIHGSYFPDQKHHETYKINIIEKTLA